MKKIVVFIMAIAAVQSVRGMSARATSIGSLVKYQPSTNDSVSTSSPSSSDSKGNTKYFQNQNSQIFYNFHYYHQSGVSFKNYTKTVEEKCKLEEKNNALTKEKESLREALNRLNDSSLKLIAEFEQIKTENDALNKQLVNAQNNKSLLQKNLEDTEIQCIQNNDLAGQQLTKLNSRLEAKEQQIKEQEEKITTLKSNLEALDSRRIFWKSFAIITSTAFICREVTTRYYPDIWMNLAKNLSFSSFAEKMGYGIDSFSFSLSNMFRR